MDVTKTDAAYAACAQFDFDPARMLDILWHIQDVDRCIDAEALTRVAELTGRPRVSVEGVASFYHFYSGRPKGRYAIYLCDDIIDRLHGLNDLIQVIKDELGISPGETTGDGLFQWI